MTALRQPDFRALWTACLISDLGDWMLLVGLPVYVFTLSGSALVTSTVLVAELVPTVLLGQVAGVLVDRWDTRRTLVLTGLAQAVALLPLLVATSMDRLWLVYVVAAVQSCLAGLCDPARAALVPALVGPDRLASANSMTAAGENVARLAGSPLGGLAVQWLGLSGLVAVDAATYLASAAMLTLVRRVPRGEPTATGRSGLAHEWLDGVRVVRRTRPLPGLFLVGALAQLAQGIFVVLFVVFVLRQLHGSGSEVGLLRGVQAIGGVLGGLVIGLLARRLSARALVGWGFLGFGALSLLTWTGPHLTTALGVYIGLFIVVGVPGVAASTGLLTTVQQATPPSHLGRVVSTMQAAAGATQALGLLLAGGLADRFGVEPILIGQALLYVGCGALGLALLAERRPHPTASPLGRPEADPAGVSAGGSPCRAGHAGDAGG